MFNGLACKRLLRATVIAMVGGIVAVAGCKKKVEPPPPPPPQVVEVRLQVSRITPNPTSPNVPVSGTLYGSAFSGGASVHFIGAGGETAGTEVQVRDSNTIGVMIPGLAIGTYDVRVTNGDGDQTTLRQGLTVKVLELPCKFAKVHFTFDGHGLNSSARGTLDGHMSCYQSDAGQISVSGHADERGTVDYNLALGQRRADAVKRHLKSGGVSDGRINTTSYGEERPAENGHGEVAWSKNRRAELSASQ